MAIFKVGQRVAANYRSTDGVVPKDAEGTVVEVTSNFLCPYSVRFDNYPCPDTKDDLYICDADDIRPLTDPKADAFIESLKRLRYEEPKAPRPETIPARELDKYRGGSQ